LAKDSKVVEALIAAAKNGKKVTVVIELLARFDESSNIKWSKRMKDAGINVIFGVEGLKVHSKLLWVEMSGGPASELGTFTKETPESIRIAC
jgi:polyphosphate kinase